MNDEKIYFRSDKGNILRKKIWDILKTKEMMGVLLCRHIPFVHAFTGSDTTSRIYNVGKGYLLKRFVRDEVLQHHADVFCCESQHSDVEVAGEHIFVNLYDGTRGEDLNT